MPNTASKHKAKRQEESGISTCCIPGVARSSTPAPARKLPVLPPLKPFGLQLLSAGRLLAHEQELNTSQLLQTANTYVVAASDNLNCYAVMQDACLFIRYTATKLQAGQ